MGGGRATLFSAKKGGPEGPPDAVKNPFAGLFYRRLPLGANFHTINPATAMPKIYNHTLVMVIYSFFPLGGFGSFFA